MDKSVFDVPYSIPSYAHSIAVTTRRPSSGYAQSHMYLPDYGGSLDVPEHSAKNNAIGGKLPFIPKSHYIKVDELNPRPGSRNRSTQSIISLCYIDQLTTIIRAVGSVLCLDVVDSIPYDPDLPTAIKSRKCAYVPYAHTITGVKEGSILDHIVLNFDQGVKLLKLNQPASTGGYSLDFHDQPVIDHVASIPEKRNLVMKDACAPRNKTIAMVGSNADTIQVCVHDLNSKQLYSTIGIKLENSRLATASNTPRTFVPIKNVFEEVQQIDCDPSHLFNMTMATTEQVSSIDPRISKIGVKYVDKNEITSFLPGENLGRICFSHQNDHQFYSLSNMNLRVFDKRMVSIPINSVSHMLDPEQFEGMCLASFKLKDQSTSESLCIASFGRLSFMTFERDATQECITPRSLHQPIQEPSLSELTGDTFDELVGLSMAPSSIFCDEAEFVFALIQMSKGGHIYVRAYQRDGEMDYYSRASIIASQSIYQVLDSWTQTGQTLDTGYVPTDSEEDDECVSTAKEYLNIFDPDNLVTLDDSIETSSRAKQKYESMKRRLTKEV